MSESTDKALTRLEVLVRGPAEMKDIAAEAVQGLVKRTMDRLNSNEETAGVAAKIGHTLTILGGTYMEAMVTEKIVLVEKARAETIKTLYEANKIEAETQKTLADEEVSQATAEKLRSEAMKNRVEAVKTALEIMEKHANPIIDALVKDALFDAGEENSRAAFSLGVNGRELAEPAGDKARTVDAAEG